MCVINLSNIKVAVFDFDDTLAVHRNKDYSINRDNSYFIKARLNPAIFYTTIEPCYVLPEMLKVTERCREIGAVMYCLSGMRCSLHAEAKKAYIEQNYGDDIELLMAKSQAMKLEVIAMLQEIHKCKAEEILYVDDNVENIVNAQKEGYVAVDIKHIAEIVI